MSPTITPTNAIMSSELAAYGRNNNNNSAAQQQHHRGFMFERRKRRAKNSMATDKVLSEHSNTKSGGGEPHKGIMGGRLSSSSKQRAADLDDEELDPYDSDPGESYRQHCMSVSGIGTKSCVPSLFKIKGRSNETVGTAPPSPMPSEMGDFCAVPASLPQNPILVAIGHYRRSRTTTAGTQCHGTTRLASESSTFECEPLE
jgi:hypothetical protein